MGYLIVTLLILSSFTQLAFSGDLDMNDEEYTYNGLTLKFSITPNANVVDQATDLISSTTTDSYPDCAIECYQNINSCSLFSYDANTSTCAIYSGTSFTVQPSDQNTTGFFVGTN